MSTSGNENTFSEKSAKQVFDDNVVRVQTHLNPITN
jgi:hypothetical protein